MLERSTLDAVILATPKGLHAMGVWSAGQPTKGFEQVGYGRFRFAPQKVVKWNCMFRVTHPKAIRTGNYTFRCYVLVGSLKNVTDTMTTLHRRLVQTSTR